MEPTPDPKLRQDDAQYASSTVCKDHNSACVSDPSNAELDKMKSDGSQAADRVRAFYTSGIPFFTKDAIADLAAQLDRERKLFQNQSARGEHRKGDSHKGLLTLQTLDGKTVEVESELGTAWPRGRSKERVMVDFVINYQTYQHLITVNKDPDGFTAKLAYCPLLVEYHARTRFTDTKAFKSPPKSKPLEATQIAFRAGVKAWEDSEECQKLRSSLMASALPDKITKIIAFACCTISSGRQISEVSISQHALILTIKDILQKKNLAMNGEIRLYAQDPVYEDVDKAVLEAAGIHILDDPYGFLEVDDSSIVISFSPNVPVRQIVADIACPAIMIWDNVTPEDEMIQSWSEQKEKQTFENVEELEGNLTDPESSRLREMVENHYTEIHKLAEDIFGDSCIYVRRFEDSW